MKILLIACLTMATFSIYAQSSFEKGIIIDKNKKKIECYILNKDWNKNPKTIIYRIHDNDEDQTFKVDELLEFSIDNKIKMLWANVEIDLSSDKIGGLTTDKEPRFVEKKILLKQLVVGAANLFESQEKHTPQLFFYQFNSSDIKQLVYKKYRANNTSVGYKEAYKLQLWNDLKCTGDNSTEYSKIDYNKTDLVKHFIKYNTCVNSNFKVYSQEKKHIYNLKVKAGVNLSNMTIERGLNAGGTEMPIDASAKVGLEGEFILPFNNNKWGVFIESSYNSYTFQSDFGTNPSTVSIDINYLEFGLGLRHYLYLKNSSKIFIQTNFMLTAPLHTEIVYTNVDMVMTPELNEINMNHTLNLGLGYAINKFSFSANYSLNRKISGYREVPKNYSLKFESTFSNFSFVVGYELF